MNIVIRVNASAIKYAIISECWGLRSSLGGVGCEFGLGDISWSERIATVIGYEL